MSYSRAPTTDDEAFASPLSSKKAISMPKYPPAYDFDELEPMSGGDQCSSSPRGDSNETETSPHYTNSKSRRSWPGSTYSGHPILPPDQHPARFRFRRNKSGHHFNRKEQYLHQLKMFMSRLVVTLALCGMIIGIYMFYQRKGVLSRKQKHWFTATHMGLSIALGLNLASSYKGFADIFRWRVLASQREGGHDAKQLDLVLGMNGYGNCVKLLWQWIQKPRYFFLLMGWIALGIVRDSDSKGLFAIYNSARLDVSQVTSIGLGLRARVVITEQSKC